MADVLRGAAILVLVPSAVCFLLAARDQAREYISRRRFFGDVDAE